MKTTTTTISLLATSLMSRASVSGAPTPQFRTVYTDITMKERSPTHGCTPDGLYFVSANGIDTLFECQGGCEADDNGQPRCNNGVMRSSEQDPDAVPFPVVPVS